jgi:methionyl-tRNA formyltransferase
MPSLILTDNAGLLPLARELARTRDDVTVFQSPGGSLGGLGELDVRGEVGDPDLILSLHCRQIFPAELVERVRCVNVHPGLNPHNRGWFPHVFSLLNGRPAGVTIHVMDARLDHGPIIARREVPIEAWDDSGALYARILAAEAELLREWFPRLVAGDYAATPPAAEGALHTKRDWESLRELDLAAEGTLGRHLDLLRALSHEGYRNAWFRDAAGRRVFVRVVLEPED